MGFNRPQEQDPVGSLHLLFDNHRNTQKKVLGTPFSDEEMTLGDVK